MVTRNGSWSRSPKLRSRMGVLGHVLLTLVVTGCGVVPVIAAFVFDWPVIATVVIIALAPTTQLPLAWMIFSAGVRRYPSVHPAPRTATVIGTQLVEVGAEASSSVRLYKVAIHDGPETFTSLIADVFEGEERDTFDRDSKWQVYEFCHSRARVVLTEAHDDLWRKGYELSGLRLGNEYTGSSGYGSEIVARGFRGQTRRLRQPALGPGAVGRAGTVQ